VSEKQTVVVGLGEVGKPLMEILSRHYETIGVDVVTRPLSTLPSRVDVLHICYPFEIPDFVGETVRYIELLKPALTVINSTVGVGTTRAVAERTGGEIASSPVRGKHVSMLEDMMKYTKFVGGMNARCAERAALHLAGAGFKTKVLSTPEATELAKLTETTYFGVLIAWAQEIERYCDLTGQSYDEVSQFYEEIPFLPPVKYFPGVIGGHCVMPNIKILSKLRHSEVLKAIQTSNEKKMERESAGPKWQAENAVAAGAK
jgi:UDP-N-acetyl-D-mannosaminuronate dehydrogenase